MDRYYTFGLIVLFMGWVVLNIPYAFLVGYPVYLVGAAFIWLSGKPPKRKLWLIIPPFFLNLSTMVIIMKQLESYF